MASSASVCSSVPTRRRARSLFCSARENWSARRPVQPLGVALVLADVHPTPQKTSWPGLSRQLFQAFSAVSKPRLRHPHSGSSLSLGANLTFGSSLRRRAVGLRQPRRQCPPEHHRQARIS